MKKGIKKLIILITCIVIVMSQTQVCKSAAYQYDKLGRLVKVVYENGDYISYVYDASGNIKTIKKYVNGKEEPVPTPKITEENMEGEYQAALSQNYIRYNNYQNIESAELGINNQKVYAKNLMLNVLRIYFGEKLASYIEKAWS